MGYLESGNHCPPTKFRSSVQPALSIAPKLAEKGGALRKERWAGAIDSVGSTTLANVLTQTVQNGAVAACSLAGGADLPTTVMPHILHGVALPGINSVTAPHAERDKAWTILAESLDRALLATMTTVKPNAAGRRHRRRKGPRPRRHRRNALALGWLPIS